MDDTLTLKSHLGTEEYSSIEQANTRLIQGLKWEDLFKVVFREKTTVLPESIQQLFVLNSDDVLQASACITCFTVLLMIDCYAAFLLCYC